MKIGSRIISGENPSPVLSPSLVYLGRHDQRDRRSPIGHRIGPRRGYRLHWYCREGTYLGEWHNTLQGGKVLK
jgi:hypothetical protein